MGGRNSDHKPASLSLGLFRALDAATSVLPVDPNLLQKSAYPDPTVGADPELPPPPPPATAAPLPTVVVVVVLLLVLPAASFEMAALTCLVGETRRLTSLPSRVEDRVERSVPAEGGGVGKPCEFMRMCRDVEGGGEMRCRWVLDTDPKTSSSWLGGER